MKLVRPVLLQCSEPCILDIGFGGGDLPILLRSWALSDKIPVKITAIDNDFRALDFIKKFQPEEMQFIEFREASLVDLVAEGKKYSVTLSNHVLHHLSDRELLPFFENSKKVTQNLVLHSDLRRSTFSYYAFSVSALAFRNSFITQDGRASIARSFKKHELQSLLDDTWEIRNEAPFRLIAICKKQMY